MFLRFNTQIVDRYKLIKHCSTIVLLFSKRTFATMGDEDEEHAS